MWSEVGANYMEISEGVIGKREWVKGEMLRRVGKRLERGKDVRVKAERWRLYAREEVVVGSICVGQPHCDQRNPQNCPVISQS